MTKRTKFIHILALMCLVSFSSCGMRLKGAKKGGGGTVETFFVEGGITQYFIKPIEFTSARSSMTIDFTTRGKADTSFKGKANFTLSSDAATKVDGYKIVGNGTVLSAGKITTSGAGKDRRYFSEVNDQQLFKLLSSNSPFTIVLITNGAEEAFTPTRKAAKKLTTAARVLSND